MTTPELVAALVGLVVSCVLVCHALQAKGDVKALINSWFGSIALEVKDKKPPAKKRRRLASRKALPKEPTVNGLERREQERAG